MDDKQPIVGKPSEKATENKTVREFWLSRILTVVVTLFGVAYLIAIPFGGIDQDHRFGLVEALVLTIILIFNSGLIQRLESFAVTDKGFSIQLKQLQKEQNKQQAQLQSVVEFLINNFVSKHEFEHLEHLSKEEPVFFNKSYESEGELRRLRAIGFIQPTRPNVIISQLPHNENLRDYFTVTASGRAYLDFRKQFPPVDSA